MSLKENKMTVKTEVKGVPVVVNTKRIGFNRYSYVASAMLKPFPIMSAKGSARGLSMSVCRAINATRSLIIGMEDM